MKTVSTNLHRFQVFESPLYDRAIALDNSLNDWSVTTGVLMAEDPANPARTPTVTCSFT